MLNVWLKGFREDCIVDPVPYFNVMKKKDWFNREDVKRIIWEIDKTVAVKDEYLESPVYGAIAPERLSSGCKCLILLYLNPKCNVYATRMGDNCLPLLLELAEKEDVVVTFHHIPRFPNSNVEVKFLDSGYVANSRREFLFEYGRITGRF